MEPLVAEHRLLENRRQFFGRGSRSIGALALASLLNPQSFTRASDLAQIAPKAKRVIYMLQSGAPSQVDLIDYKPELEKLHGTELPDSIRQGQRLTGMTAGQKSFPVIKSPWNFKQYGNSGTWLSELMPHLGNVVDDICIIKSLHTEAINHDPAITFFSIGTSTAGQAQYRRMAELRPGK